MNDEPIVSTREQIGTYDAIETAKPGEPLFPIQGGDPLGPATVQFWADEFRKIARAEPDEKLRAAMLRKALAAEQVAWAMQAYQRGEEIDDALAGRAHQHLQVVDDGHKWKLYLTAATRHLRGAAFEFTQALPHLPAAQARTLESAIETINRIATDYEPKRASYGNQPELPIHSDGSDG